MKITLINLPTPYIINPFKQIPIGLLYISAVLEKTNNEIEICNLAQYNEEEAITKIKNSDIFGITATCVQINQANRFARIIKSKYPESKLILGGPGTVARELIDYNIFDSVCFGDGEKVILKMLEDMPNLKKEYNIIVQNIDSLPFPARHHLKEGIGTNLIYNDKDVKSTLLITSRGCPFSCAFCTSPKTNKDRGSFYRCRSPENIYDEIVELIEKYGVNQIGFTDDVFTVMKDRTIEICKLIKPLKINWRIFCRVKPFDIEIAEIMQNAGCEEIGFGVESFDDSVLNMINKKTTAKDNFNALKICADIGLKTKVLLILRVPGQTKDTMKKNIEAIENVKYGILSCHNFIPLPGSDIWDNPHKYNIEIINRNIDTYNFYIYSKTGRNKFERLIKPLDRDIEEFNNEVEEFLNYVEKFHKINKG